MMILFSSYVLGLQVGVITPGSHFSKYLNNSLLILSAIGQYLDCFQILQSSEQSCHQDPNVGFCVDQGLWSIWVNIRRPCCWIEWKAYTELCKRWLSCAAEQVCLFAFLTVMNEISLAPRPTRICCHWCSRSWPCGWVLSRLDLLLASWMPNEWYYQVTPHTHTHTRLSLCCPFLPGLAAGLCYGYLP